MTCYCAAMRGVLLNEWRRIGIVLSVAWGIGVSIFTWQSAEVLINDTQSYYYNCIFRLGEEGHCGEQLRVLEAATWHVAREHALGTSAHSRNLASPLDIRRISALVHSPLPHQWFAR
jgi:hypothetical protein